ncbi:MAG: acetolactate decarboxylase [Phenylobacterium sp.]|jgi:acetolactate decarboxylase
MKQSRHNGLLTLLLCLTMGSCAATGVWQNSPVIGLLNGQFDGITTVKTARQHGEQGLMAWDKLNGEGLAIDGIFYQFSASGGVNVMTNTDTMAWLSISPFKPQTHNVLPPGLTFAKLADYVPPNGSTKNSYYAFTITGEFSQLETRTYFEQRKPYTYLCAAPQKKTQWSKVKGTMVGFYSPTFTTNMSVPGLHMHFITADRSGGGHVLDFQLTSGVLAVDQLNDVDIAIPQTPSYQQANLSVAAACP